MSVHSAERYYDRYVDTEENLYLGWISDDEFDAGTAAMFFDIMKGDSVVYFTEKTKTAYDAEIVRIRENIEEGDVKLGLAMIDLNFLKKLNDTYGHDKGNIAIKKLCHLVCVTFKHSPVFRIGGDEFVVILRGNDYEHYDELTASFNRELEEMSEDPSLEPWEKVSAAVGAAFYDPSVDENIDSLLKRADAVMYERKKEMKAARED